MGGGGALVWDQAHYQRSQEWSDERGGGGMSVMVKEEEGSVGDCRTEARRSLVAAGEVEEMARRMRKLEGCSAI